VVMWQRGCGYVAAGVWLCGSRGVVSRQINHYSKTSTLAGGKRVFQTFLEYIKRGNFCMASISNNIHFIG